jgi:HEAT repeat protein
MEAASSPNPQVRFRAAWALGEGGDASAFETLLHLTRDPDAAVAYDAIVALGNSGDMRALEPLLELLLQEHERPEVSGAAGMALQRLGNDAVPRLIQALQEARGEICQKLLYALGSIEDERAIQAVSRFLEDPSPDTRIAAVESLASLNTPECLDLIRPLAQDEDASVREVAVYWVAEITAE